VFIVDQAKGNAVFAIAARAMMVTFKRTELFGQFDEGSESIVNFLLEFKNVYFFGIQHNSTNKEPQCNRNRLQYSCSVLFLKTSHSSSLFKNGVDSFSVREFLTCC